MVDAIKAYMPEIDKLLEEDNVPVFDRLFRAALLFVDLVVIDSSFDTKQELIKSKAFSDAIIPPINDWYWDKYGSLMSRPTVRYFSGLVKLYSQPVKIEIPATLSKVEEEGKTAWLIFPDHLYEAEDVKKMFPGTISIDDQQTIDDAAIVVKYTRSINLALNLVSGLSDEAKSMSSGIWGHFEKAISDILTFKNEVASVGCWELHLAIEKSFKVVLNQKTGKKHTGHDLKTLSKTLNKYLPNLDLSPINVLPSDKEAIKMRYSEQVRTVNEALRFYKTSLLIVYRITSAIDNDLTINNASFLLKKAPWAR
ncbi:MAG: hypothetical protein HGB26_08455 [Desulfobulbaceae bacterium]|nr:hypothetical protein [Desulfobulbaceae bacterium]